MALNRTASIISLHGAEGSSHVAGDATEHECVAAREQLHDDAEAGDCKRRDEQRQLLRAVPLFAAQSEHVLCVSAREEIDECGPEEYLRKKKIPATYVAKHSGLQHQAKNAQNHQTHIEQNCNNAELFVAVIGGRERRSC